MSFMSLRYWCGLVIKRDGKRDFFEIKFEIENVLILKFSTYIIMPKTKPVFILEVTRLMQKFRSCTFWSLYYITV